MSNIGFGQDRPYGAFDDDDDFIEEWSASWEPAAPTTVEDVAEPASQTVPEPDISEQAPAAEAWSYAPEPVDEAPSAEEPAPAEMFQPYGSAAAPVEEAPVAEEPTAPEMFPQYSSPYSAPAQTPERPIYKKWWFWGAVGAAVAGVAVTVVVTSSDTRTVLPEGSLGTWDRR